MNSQQVRSILPCAIAWLLISSVHGAEACEPRVASIISVQGNVEVIHTGKARWRRVKLEQNLCAGDRVRVDSRGRAAILLANRTVLRLDEGSTITFSKIEPDKPSWLELLKGAVHFLSRVPRSLEIKTPFVNAGIEGTEFVLRVGSTQTEILVFDGQVRVSNAAGSLLLANGQAAVAKAGKAPTRRIIVKPRKAVQWALYYPPIIDYRQFSGIAGPGAQALRESIAQFRSNDIAEAFAALDAVPGIMRNADYFTLRAAMLLSVGRIDEAEPDITQALDLAPQYGTAYALLSIIAVAQNEDEKALHLAQKAVDLSPQSPVPQIALSYAHQALFDIEQALESAQKAVDISPDDALAWARIAELQLSLGDLDHALAAARRAIKLDPDLARTQTVLGFANLTRIDIDQAQAAFKKAIELDSASPLPRLGLGLATIRSGDLNKGTEQIEIAASLDPDNALIRSYLGKAYYEQKRDKLAATEFAIAKGLDPNDPTPYLYDAILLQTENQPVVALDNIEKSIDLNDNRAVYRSRLLLDRDNAVRGTSLARIYADLGFEQLGQLEASRSLSIDPANYSAHRFLSDTYAARSRHEIARVSELLQSQLLQPINIRPVQPQLNETNLNIVTGIGPAAAAFDEYTPLFVRDQTQLTASGVVGSNDTFSDEVVISGTYDRFSYSLAQFHYETNGFRENNDVEHNIYNAFGQVALTDKINLQFEYRQRNTDQGDIALNFLPERSINERRDLNNDTFRLGLHMAPTPMNNIIASLIYLDRNEGITSIVPDFATITRKFDDSSYDVQSQYLLHHERFNLIIGGGISRTDRDELQSFSIPSFDPIETDVTINEGTAYIYANAFPVGNVAWTLGVSYDAFDDESLDTNKINPKVGMQWRPNDIFLLRGAYFKTLKRLLITNQTLEPTQIAGFNQFFDDPNGSETEVYGIGIDTAFSPNIHFGIELTDRDLDIPNVDPFVPTEDQDEDLYRLYSYWAPSKNWSVSAGVILEEIKPEFKEPRKLQTLTVPLTVEYFSPTGFFGQVGTSYVNQEVNFSLSPTLDEDFVLVDAALGYRLPKRRGIASIEVTNLFDKDFRFQDLAFVTSDQFKATAPFIPDRVLIGRLTLSF